MQLIKWEPLSDIERFFEDFPLVSLPRFGWDLAADLYEHNGSLVATMNLPGIDPERIDVSVEGGMLRVSGSREEEKEERGKRYFSKEIRRGAFERSVRLPKSVDRSKIDARYQNGLLQVTMPVIKSPDEASVRKKVRT
jgi:HSP20 family protein